MPQISGSGSCSRTAAEISCSCESRGNPSPSMEWRVSGLRVTNSTDRVIREEQLGNTGLRSSLTMRHSHGDTPTLLCLSTNTLGSSSLQLLVPPVERFSVVFSIGLLVIGILAGALVTGLLWGVTQCCTQRKSRLNENTVPTSDQSDNDPSSLNPPHIADENTYDNQIIVAGRQREGEEHGEAETQTQIQTETQSQAADDSLHYASVTFTTRTNKQESSGAVKDPPQEAGEGENVLYSTVVNR
ncbi:hypothetical protein JZ751_026996 [Albula glossodonta]|uniref:Ig-like domain-containing protein n=1 Tax=Albula glossodonta TaxID=121402 RepID=A0A8T2MQ59_9TELE|nr:hypothetical protein JZ751_026996 [Albula glossodonta]